MNLPVLSLPPADLKDPRIRITFADVAMRLAHDGPMYGVLTLVGVLALRGNIEGLQAVVGAAIALQARSRPPESDKLDRLTRGVVGGSALVIGTFFVASQFTGCTGVF